MKDFCVKNISYKDRKSMERFLKNHFRYNTNGGWNHSTSYANNMKIYNLGLPREKEEILYELLSADNYEEILWPVNKLINNFKRKYNYKFQPGVNGRSDGYLVLYQGGIKDGRIYTYPIRHMDMEEDCFDTWSDQELEERVKLVQDFDILCNNIIKELSEIAGSYTVIEKEILVPKKTRLACKMED